LVPTVAGLRLRVGIFIVGSSCSRVRARLTVDTLRLRRSADASLVICIWHR
jgi:hypothetical protein